MKQTQKRGKNKERWDKIETGTAAVFKVGNSPERVNHGLQTDRQTDKKAKDTHRSGNKNEPILGAGGKTDQRN